MLRSLTSRLQTSATRLVTPGVAECSSSRRILASSSFLVNSSSSNNTFNNAFCLIDHQDTMKTGLMTSMQVRHRRKKKLKQRRQLPRPVFNNQWEDPLTYTWDTKGLERKRRAAGLRPQYRDILIIRDFKFGLTGQQMRLKAKHAFKFVTQVPPVAVFHSPEAYQKHIIEGIVKDKFNGDEQAFLNDLNAKKDQFRTRFLLQRIAVKFQRRVDGPGKEFKFPITKKDLADRIWNLTKVPLQPEQIAMPGHFPNRPIKKPGYYKCWVTLNDGLEERVKLRVYLKGGGIRLQGY